MARSRCSFSILIRYGSLKISSINAFLGGGTGMIPGEEGLFRRDKPARARLGRMVTAGPSRPAEQPLRSRTSDRVGHGMS